MKKRSKQLCINLRDYGKRATPHQQRCMELAARMIEESDARENALNLRIAYLESSLNDQRQYIEQQDATIGKLMDASEVTA